MASNLQPKGAEMLFASLPPAAAQAFAEDHHRPARPSAWCASRDEDATAAYRCTCGALRTWWKSTTSSSAPSLVADFAAYHPLWFTRRVVPMMTASLTPPRRGASRHWGRGASKNSAHRRDHRGGRVKPMPLLDDIFQDEHGIALGSQVQIAAESRHRSDRRRAAGRHPHPATPCAVPTRAQARCMCTFRASDTC